MLVAGPQLWPHQRRGIDQVLELIRGGEQRICLTSPTGGGKSRMMTELIRNAEENGQRVALYTNRKMLTEQLIRVLGECGITFGVRAAGFDDHEATSAIQICSADTELSRTYQKKVWGLHRADLVIFDELHMQKAGLAQRIVDDHLSQGAEAFVGMTATPLGISHMAKRLVVAGVNSELRKCGAHVPCYVYGPDEPDTRKIKRQKTGEYSINDIRKSVWTTSIFGRVLDYWKRLNPDGRPAILFAPGVKESIWFVQQFERKGIRAAHIDGSDCYMDGQQYKTSRQARDEILEQIKDGSIKVVCNRFVMREGIDIPELYHCILATPIGSLLSYLQTVGRVLRAHPSLDHVVLQDHGGNWWRHGSPNIDRDWGPVFGLPVRVVTDLRLERMREKKEPEPITCPKCSAIRLGGHACHSCGFEHTKRSRLVLQANGALKEMEGDILKPRRRAQRANTEELWKKMYFRARRSRNNMTFRQAEGLFMYENHYLPPRDFPYYPKDDLDMFLPVKDVPKERVKWPEKPS